MVLWVLNIGSRGKVKDAEFFGNQENVWSIIESF